MCFPDVLGQARPDKKDNNNEDNDVKDKKDQGNEDNEDKYINDKDNEDESTGFKDVKYDLLAYLKYFLV